MGENVIARLKRGAFVLTLSTLVVKALGLIYKIPLSYILSSEGLGYFNTAYTVYSLFYVISVSGVAKAMSILIPTEDDSGDGFSLYKLAHRCFLSIGAGLSVFLLISAFLIAQIIGSPDAGFSLALIAPSILFTAALGVMRGFLNAKLCYTEIATSHIVEALVKLIAGISLSYLGVYFSLDVKYCAALGIFGVTLGSVITYFYLLIIIKNYKTKEKTRQTNAKDAMRKIFKISVPITISALVMSLSGIIDLFLVIRRLIDAGMSITEATAVYGSYTTFVVPLISLANAIISPVAISFIPILSQTLKNGDPTTFNCHFKAALKACAFISVPIFFGLYFYSFEVLMLLFNEAGAYECATVLSLSAPSVIFITLFTLLATVIEACGHVRAPIIAIIVGSLVKIIMSYLTIGGRFGILGASLGTLACYLIATIILILYFRLKIGIFPPIISSYAMPALRSAVMIMVTSSLVKRLSPSNDRISRVAIILMTSITVYFSIYFLECLLNTKGTWIRQNAQKTTM